MKRSWFKSVAVLLLILTLLLSLAVPAFAAEDTETVDDTVLSLEDFPIDEEYYRNNPYRGTVLNVYNWGEYISDGSEGALDVNKYFEELTGIKVNYTNFDSNEDMYAKVKSGGANYDIVIPSDYMIQRMSDEGMLLKLDFENIPNYKYIDKQYTGLYYDPEEAYTVPYNVGYVALIYNTAMVVEEPDSWMALWDERYAGSILMFNNPRDAFGLAQFVLGQDVNTTDPADWEAAYNLLLEQKPVVRAYVMDEIFNIMESGAAALAPYYVGDYFTMADNNENLAIAFPKEGANIFVDAMCIPETCRNKGAAELYINFMEEPEIALANAEYICYATPNTVVRNLDEYSFRGDDILYPDSSVMENYQYFYNLPAETQTMMSEYWSDLKVWGYTNLTSYLGIGAFALTAAVYGIFRLVRRKKREKYYD